MNSCNFTLIDQKKWKNFVKKSYSSQSPASPVWCPSIPSKSLQRTKSASKNNRIIAVWTQRQQGLRLHTRLKTHASFCFVWLPMPHFGQALTPWHTPRSISPRRAFSYRMGMSPCSRLFHIWPPVTLSHFSRSRALILLPSGRVSMWPHTSCHKPSPFGCVVASDPYKAILVFLEHFKIQYLPFLYLFLANFSSLFPLTEFLLWFSLLLSLFQFFRLSNKTWAFYHGLPEGGRTNKILLMLKID